MFNLADLKIIEESMIDSYVEGRFVGSLQEVEDIIYRIHQEIQSLEIQLRIRQYDAMHDSDGKVIL
jgi:hypothetical protein